jgi:hypothetical protein
VVDLLFLIFSVPIFALAWRGVEWIVFRFVRQKYNAPRYVTLIYDVLAVGGGIALALYNLFTPLTRRHREVGLHHAFVGGILFIAIAWGYPAPCSRSGSWLN